MSLLKNVRNRGLKDILNPRKWKMFMRYKKAQVKALVSKDKMKALIEEYQELRIPEYQEQVVLRMLHPGCQECIDNGECIHCGCKSPELFYDMTNECSAMNWFTMEPPDMWRKNAKYKSVPKKLIDNLITKGRP